MTARMSSASMSYGSSSDAGLATFSTGRPAAHESSPSRPSSPSVSAREARRKRLSNKSPENGISSTGGGGTGGNLAYSPADRRKMALARRRAALEAGRPTLAGKGGISSSSGGGGAVGDVFGDGDAQAVTAAYEDLGVTPRTGGTSRKKRGEEEEVGGGAAAIDADTAAAAGVRLTPDSTALEYATAQLRTPTSVISAGNSTSALEVNDSQMSSPGGPQSLKKVASSSSSRRPVGISAATRSYKASPNYGRGATASPCVNTSANSGQEYATSSAGGSEVSGASSVREKVKSFEQRSSPDKKYGGGALYNRAIDSGRVQKQQHNASSAIPVRQPQDAGYPTQQQQEDEQLHDEQQQQVQLQQQIRTPRNNRGSPSRQQRQKRAKGFAARDQYATGANNDFDSSPEKSMGTTSLVTNGSSSLAYSQSTSPVGATAGMATATATATPASASPLNRPGSRAANFAPSAPRTPETAEYDFHDIDDATQFNSVSSNYDDMLQLPSQAHLDSAPRPKRRTARMAAARMDSSSITYSPQLVTRSASGHNSRAGSVSATSFDDSEGDNSTTIAYGEGSSVGGGPGKRAAAGRSGGMGGTGSAPSPTYDDDDTATEEGSWTQNMRDRQARMASGSWNPGGRKKNRMSGSAKGVSWGEGSGRSGTKARDGLVLESENDPGWALNEDDLKAFRAQLEQPVVKAALGTSAAVVAGVAIFGPIGILVGAASVGIGVGIMQIPEEQRATMSERTKSACHQTYESAMIAADAMGTSCATACEQSGVSDKLHPKIAKICAEGAEHGCGSTEDTVIGDNINIGLSEGSHAGRVSGRASMRDTGSSMSRMGDRSDSQVVVTSADGQAGADGGAMRHQVDDDQDGSTDGTRMDGHADGHSSQPRRKVACLRKGRIVPVNQIHALQPSRQPRAWLDVMASISTTREEKNEAMEELLIFIKDKGTALMLLDEGILDSLVYILSCFFRKYTAIVRESADGNLPANYQSDPDFFHSKLAANCCIALGKAHCAIVHTEGDLLLMSSYSRGTVPVERQLAQMLYEVPHHTSMTAGTSMYPEGAQPQNAGKEAFTLTELSLQHAEELAKSIHALTQGTIVTQT